MEDNNNIQEAARGEIDGSVEVVEARNVELIVVVDELFGAAIVVGHAL